MNIDPKLYDFCTDKQREVLEAIDLTGSGRQAAAQLGCDRSYPPRVFEAVRKT